MRTLASPFANRSAVFDSINADGVVTKDEAQNAIKAADEAGRRLAKKINLDGFDLVNGLTENSVRYEKGAYELLKDRFDK